jgi:hypothetical protein
MRHILIAVLVAAGLALAVPTWAQSPAMSYSFGQAVGAASNGDLQPPSRAPGADALRWLGGLGSTQTESRPAPLSAGAVGGSRRE